MATSGTQKTASRSRKAVRKGSKGPKSVRQGQRTAASPAAASIAAHSIASLKLAPLSGIEVHCVMDQAINTDRAGKMLGELTDAYLAAEKHWNGLMFPDVLPPCQTDAQRLAALLKRFEERFCTGGIKYIIEEQEDRWCFKLYQFCNWRGEWNTIEVKPLYNAAKKTSEKLAKLLLIFIGALERGIDAGTWYNGALEDAEQWVQDRIEEDWEYDPPSDYEEETEKRSLLNDLNDHLHGKSAQVGHLIRNAVRLNPDEILADLNRIKKCHPIKEAIRLGCGFLKEPYNIFQFEHPECDDDVDCENSWGADGLRFCEQTTILWEYDNALTSMAEEWLNSRHNESGYTQGPIATFMVDARNESWDRTHFDNAPAWPGKLYDLFSAFREAAIEKDPTLLINILA